MDMKLKAIVFSLILTVTASLTYGQFQLGFKAGADINKLDGQAFKDGFSFGYQLGGFAVIKLSDKLSIQPEVLFSQVNVDTSDNFRDIYSFDRISEVQLKYLKIPIMLNINLSKVFTVQVGPQFGILIDQNINLVNNGKEAFKSGDFSMQAGAQLNFAKFHIYGRYGIGMSNLNDLDNREDWKSQQIQLGIGVRIL